MKPIMTDDDLAGELNVQVETIRAYVKDKKLRAARVGALYLFTAESVAADINRLIEAEDHKTPPAPAAVLVKRRPPDLTQVGYTK